MSWHKQWYSLLSSGGGMVPIDAKREREHSQHRWEGKLEVKSPGRRLRNTDGWQSSRDSDAGTCYHKCLKSPHSGWSDILESSSSANLVMDTQLWQGFPGGSVVKNPCASARDAHSIPGSGRSPGGGNGNSLWYSCLENSMDRGAWWAIVLGVAQSQTPLNNWVTCTLLWWRRMCSLGEKWWGNLYRNKNWKRVSFR